MDTQFEQWWNTAKLWSEFRGVSMPAALAAWLAGRKSVENVKESLKELEEPTTPAKATEETIKHVAEQSEPSKKVGKYAAEGRNAKRQAREQEAVDASPES